MMFAFRFVTAMVIGAVVMASDEVENQRGSLIRRRELRPVDCLLYELHALFPPDVVPPAGSDHAWVCEEDGRMFHIDLSDTYFKGMGAKSGQTRMRISNANVALGTTNKPPTLKIAADAVPEFLTDNSNARRKLISTTGTFSTLVVRVSSRDDQPNRSAATLSADIFTDALNFAKVMADCSASKANFIPATGGDIVNGVTEVFVDMNTQNVQSYTVEDAARSALVAKFTSSQLNNFDNIIIILPFNVNFGGAAAYAYVSGSISVYHDENGSSPGILVHEVGHNMGLGHSGDTYDGVYYEYFDWTCQMGNGAAFANENTGILSNDDFGAYCFNGPKSWYLSWYADRAVELSPVSSAWSGNLAGIDAYFSGDTTANADFVVIKITVSSSTEDFYMMYNKKEGITNDMRERRNEVVVWSAVDEYEPSKVSTSLTAGEVFSVQNFQGTSKTLRIQACSLGFTARVIVYLEGQNDISCETSSPVESPTDSPVESPTDSPVESPTDSPVDSPTDSPVESPTDSPEPGPTESPFAGSTDSPIESPTGNPNPNPSAGPISPSPTRSPTRFEEEPGPAPSPGPPSGAGGCFSENNTAEVKGRGRVVLSQLKIGDEVRVRNGAFSRIYSFGHKDATIVDQHVRIFHSAGNGQPLELTPSHMVFVDGHGAVTADKVKIGDKLFGASGKEVVVTEVSMGQSRGLYAPFTLSGDIVVSGVLASNYVAYLETTGADHHWMNHAYLTPVRVRCSFDPAYCAAESYEANGVSNLYTPSMRLIESAKTFGNWTHTVLSGLASPALYSFRLLEQVTMPY